MEDDSEVTVTMDMMISGTPCSEPPMSLTPEGTGSEEDDVVVSVTMDMISGRRLYCGEHLTHDRGLSIGRFIGIAKNALEVPESSISLVIGTEDFNRDDANARIMLLHVSKECIQTHGNLTIKAILRPAGPGPVVALVV